VPGHGSDPTADALASCCNYTVRQPKGGADTSEVGPAAPE
jgi:hypothetical protein